MLKNDKNKVNKTKKSIKKLTPQNNISFLIWLMILMGLFLFLSRSYFVEVEKIKYGEFYEMVEVQRSL